MVIIEDLVVGAPELEEMALDNKELEREIVVNGREYTAHVSLEE